MDLKHAYVLQDILKDMESCLCITASDYKDPVDIMSSNVRDRLSKMYTIDLSVKVSESIEASDKMSIFLDGIAHIHGRLSGYHQMCRCYTIIEVNLNNINYLGYSKKSMIETLAALQKKSTFVSAEDPIEKIKIKLSKTSISTEKRLFTVLVIAYDLGLTELVACIAELLYFGGVAT